MFYIHAGGVNGMVLDVLASLISHNIKATRK